MKEDFLYFVWKFKLYRNYRLFDLEFDEIQVINPGIQNSNSGPDFSSAQIKTNEATWVGNVEVDIRSSDWYRHGHHLNKDFNNVVLQVVNIHDKQVFCENGRVIPVMEVDVKPGLIEKYNYFVHNKALIPCADDIKTVDSFKIQLWLGNVLAERLNEKSGFILNILEQYKNSWEDTFYQLLARSFGFKVNSDPFEWLARSLPLKYLAKHKSNLIQIEALLLGQAGFLNSEFDGIYYKTLQKEYQFLKSKYQLNPIENHLWKFMRIRPSNFPTIRISQFANLIFKSNALFSKVLEAESIDYLRSFFEVKASEFWDNHYHFEKETKSVQKQMGKDSIDKLLINTIIPIVFVYGSTIGNDLIKEKAINFLEQIPSEKSTIINEWKKLKIQVPSAFYSQALIQQRKEYCAKSRCLECGIGIEIMKNKFCNSMKTEF
jgi:hypothetical protein